MSDTIDGKELISIGQDKLNKCPTNVICSNCGKKWKVFFPKTSGGSLQTPRCPNCSNISNAKVINPISNKVQ